VGEVDLDGAADRGHRDFLAADHGEGPAAIFLATGQEEHTFGTGAHPLPVATHTPADGGGCLDPDAHLHQVAGQRERERVREVVVTARQTTAMLQHADPAAAQVSGTAGIGHGTCICSMAAQ
jgi:hypothetical protein